MSRKMHSLASICFYMFVFSGILCTTYLVSHWVTAFSDQTLVSQRHCIVIDAGHGGIDGGATSCTGVLESTINLEIATRLDALLRLMGYNTLMIRTEDRSVYTQGNTIASQKISDLKERVRIVNNTEKAILVSIHQNQFPQERYKGAQVFYGTKDGSRNLASSLQQMFIQTLNPGSNRKAKQAAGIYLMEHIDCTGILVECGFLSNAEEEALLRSVDYQKKVCCVISAAISNHLDR